MDESYINAKKTKTTSYTPMLAPTLIATDPIAAGGTVIYQTHGTLQLAARAGRALACALA